MLAADVLDVLLGFLRKLNLDFRLEMSLLLWSDASSRRTVLERAGVVGELNHFNGSSKSLVVVE